MTIRKLCACVFVCLLQWSLVATADESSRSDAVAASASPLPYWIWHRDTCANGELTSHVQGSCRLERTFQVGQAPASAALRLAADFCHAVVAVNGRPVVSVEPYSPAIDVDVTAAIKIGENQIVISADPVAGPSAMVLSLTLVHADGKRETVITDDRWTATSPPAGKPTAAVAMGSVSAPLWGHGRRPATIDPFDNYEQWRQAVGAPLVGNEAAFWTAPGFEIALVRSAQPDDGSWISMAFDPHGRLTIAREDKGLLRMTLDGERRSVVKVESINSDLEECRGLLYAHDSLYVSANNSKGLYRLRDADEDGRFDDVRLLRQFSGGVGHGRNDLALGPDGLIYAIHGDSVDVPSEEITDYTSPFREARRGQRTSEGHLVRTDRDGKSWEVLCGGLRNPFGVAFNPQGDAFTYDADAEFDMGSSWYRPTRIVQLVPGADYGWRGVTGQWPPYFPDHPDNSPPVLDIGKGSPTAVAFGTQTNFPGEYQGALYVLDWAYGRILAVHLAPRGAGYRAQAETFLKGRPLNVTDLAIGPDRAMYLVTGGRKTQSALYRIAHGGGAALILPSGHEQACRAQADKARALRLELERRQRTIGAEAVAFAWPLLDSVDPVLRHAARIAVEHQPLETWRERALSEKCTTAALTGLFALARSRDQSSLPAVLDRLNAYLLDDLDVGQTLSLLQTYSLCLELAPQEVAERKQRMVAQLDPTYAHPAAQRLAVSPLGSGTLQRELARLLVQLESPSAVEKTVRSLLTSSVQEDRIHALLVLRSARIGWTMPLRRAYFTALNEGSTFVAGEGMPKFLAQLRDDATVSLSDAEKMELADVLSVAAPPEDETPPPVRPVVKKWTLDDLAPLLSDASRHGDAARGAVVFKDALCVRCHRVGARGPAVGPDLTHVSGRFSRRDMLQSILTPSKVVAENYRNVQVSTTDGRNIVGRVLVEGDYRSEKLRIATDPLRPSVVVELSKREIEQYRESDTSPMPDGLLNTFRVEEILDLLAFLESGARQQPP
jgi:putative heme-binding domain-containing protein